MIDLSLLVLSFVCFADSLQFPFPPNPPGACQDGSESYDSCGQRCSCVGGRLVNCVRIRKEFTSMTYAERRRHISTIETVSTSPTFRPEYESLINEHYHYFRTDIHKKKHFLPWHRYYILRYENLLRKVDCTFTVAYWDWSLDSRDPFSTTNPEDVWHSQTGFGGNGEGEDHCVLTGPFRKGKWSRVRPNWAGPGPHCLLRDFWGTPPEEVCVEEVLRMNPFHKFELALRTVLHDNVHCNINGTMCTEEAASAPEFFLHHGFIDKIWHDWQSRSDAHKHAYFPSVDETMPSTTLFPAEMICLLNQPGGVAVEYEPFQSEEIMREEMKGESVAELRNRSRRAFSGLSRKAIALFRLSPAEVKEVRELEKLIDPHVIQTD